MRLTGFVLSVVAALCLVSFGESHKLERRDLIYCDGILAVKVCDRFRNIAANLQLKASVIENKIKDAYRNGVTKAEDIKQIVDKFLEQKILSKKCEDLVDQIFCDRLDEIGQYLKLKGGELKPYIAKAIIDGAELAKDVKEKVVEYIKNDLMKKKCIDILPADKCQQIEDIGNALKLKADQIKQATIESILKGYSKVKDTVTDTLTTMKDYAANFTCTELLNPDVCVSLREYATKIRVGMPKMMNAVRTAIVLGYKVGKGFTKIVYKIADAFIDCEDFLSAEKCKKIKSVATKVGETAVRVKEAIANAVTKGITEATKIYKSALDFFNKFGRRRRSVIDGDLKSTLEKYRELLKKGIAKAEVYLKKSIAKVMDTLQIADSKIREAVEQAVLAGKTKYSDLKKYIEDLVKQQGGLTIYKRDAPSLRDLLTQALSKATGIIKYTIKKLLSMANEQLQTIKRYVQSVIDKVIGQQKRDVDYMMAEDESDKAAKENMKLISDDVADKIENMLDEVALNTAALLNELDDEKKMQKRFLDIDLSKTNLKDIVDSILKSYVGPIYEKLAAKSNELVKQIQDALQKSAGSIVDSAKIILAKINEMISNIQSGQTM